MSKIASAKHIKKIAFSTSEQNMLPKRGQIFQGSSFQFPEIPTLNTKEALCSHMVVTITLAERLKCLWYEDLARRKYFYKFQSQIYLFLSTYFTFDFFVSVLGIFRIYLHHLLILAGISVTVW